MPRRLWILAICIAAIAHASPTPAAPAPSAPPTAAVQALLQRAAQEPAAAALKTLDEAAKQAEEADDRAGALAVAERCHTLGQQSLDRRDLASAKEFHQRALAIWEKRA